MCQGFMQCNILFPVKAQGCQLLIRLASLSTATLACFYYWHGLPFTNSDLFCLTLVSIFLFPLPLQGCQLLIWLFSHHTSNLLPIVLFFPHPLSTP